MVGRIGTGIRIPPRAYGKMHHFDRNSIQSALASIESKRATWLHVGEWFNPQAGSTKPNVHLVYDDSAFLHVSQNLPPAELIQGINRIDLPEVTVLPPLFDAHTHISMCGGELDADKRSTALRRQPAEILAEATQRAQDILAMGVFGMRDGGDKDGVGLQLSTLTRLNCGKPQSSRVLSPGAGIHRHGRYGSFFSRPLEAHSSAADCVASRIAEGADHIKIVPTGIINFKKGAVTSAPQLSSDEVEALVLAAHKNNRMVMAHASGADGIANAIKGGVDTIEHAYFVKKEQLETMAKQGIVWVPTFAPVHRQIVHADIMGWDATTLGHLQRILDDHAASLQYALRLGVRVLVGSDAGSYGVPHALGLIEEMRLMEAAGMPTATVLATACLHNATTLLPHEVPPLIQVKHPASFLLAPINVTKSTAQLKNAICICNGQPLQPPSHIRLL